MTLYFENSRGQRRVIGNPENEAGAMLIIQTFLADHNFKSYYTRTWTNQKGEQVYDVGSHTEFFYLTK